ncbi:ATP-binding cassette domain-containing protein [Oceanobacillus rekensis]|uniref:ATP-binding cassette domain-containing protein n=1 Tax=Oceanobacillus rekensis TaxID=937927 RepID=UPI000B445F2B|nr:ATP-binding cassette domain-containing protein [Oceanobacillus rekensis]
MEELRKETYISVNNLHKFYGERTVLTGLNLSIEKGEFVAIVGKSGCGKSTLLRLIAGLEGINDGSIYVNAEPLNRLNEHARIMFQDGRLLPWKRVIDNVRIGLPDHAIDRAEDALKQVGLEDRLNDWPSKLSGGQKQRVALARALVHNPSLLLLDEPLGALDALTRIEMQDLIESLWAQKKFTSILVTHDVEEAVAIADRVILIEDGMISLNQPIRLPRPRQRTHPAFSMYVEEILEKILNRKNNKLALVRNSRES